LSRINLLRNRICNGDNINPKQLKYFDTIYFLVVQLKTSKDYISFLEKASGKGWRILKKNSPAEVNGSLTKITKLVKCFLPPVRINLL
jgi:hypothetical protein